MAGSNYYEKQADLLIQLALATTDPARARRYQSQARLLMNAAEISKPGRDICPAAENAAGTS